MPATKPKIEITPEVQIETGIEKSIQLIHSIETKSRGEIAQQYWKIIEFIVDGRAKDYQTMAYYKTFVEEKFKQTYDKDEEGVKSHQKSIQRILKIASYAKPSELQRWSKEKTSIDTAYGIATAKPREPITAAAKPPGWTDPKLGTPEEIAKQNQQLEETAKVAKAAVGLQKVSAPIPEDLLPTKKGEIFDPVPSFAKRIATHAHIYKDLIDHLIKEDTFTPELLNYTISKGLMINDKFARNVLETLMNSEMYRGYTIDYINDYPDFFREEINFDTPLPKNHNKEYGKEETSTTTGTGTGDNPSPNSGVTAGTQVASGS